MCGIFGYVGPREAEPILVDGLRRLEYRGYDSAGMVTLTGRHLHLRKTAGRVGDLANHVADKPAPGCIGISHTRWATHGAATDCNAHPHLAGSGDSLVAVVHNGVIENYQSLKRQLEAAGVVFRSQTDTEVIAQLLAFHHDGDLLATVRRVLPMLKGTYGLAIVSPRDPNTIVAARLGSPLVLGIGDCEHYLSSDPAALIGHTSKVVYLRDGQLAVIREDDFQIEDIHTGPVDARVETIDWELGDTDRGEFAHHMLKEIFEQPDSLENAMRGRLVEADASTHFGGLNLDPQKLRQAERIILTGCGTSYHAALVGEYLFEEFARIPVEVEYASEFRYRNPPIDRNTIVIAITQSGETADTLAALRESKRKGHTTLALCNVVGSTIAREADGGVYLHAGPEIGVASTKAFTSQVTVLAMLAIYFGRLRHLSALQGMQMIERMRQLPEIIRETLTCYDDVRRVAQRIHTARSVLYLGRNYLYPVALEGALKLKEISYIHAEGYPAAEMKHGPIALVDADTPSIFLIPRGGLFEKVMSNLEEVKARGGPVIAITNDGDESQLAHLRAKCDELILVPEVPEFLQPLICSIPLQLLAYEIAVLRGCDVDKPRNLAKSVTVE
ncbi:glutamine--fructose-6-phosphate transaminase (isomerizing) [Tuwongella immobilis]|uniref:Glutamine--fructose-6-phosphate aminotransferase [isomerizing] n=1 Tax=Tuwongella immobilis TaxID=692036 RepID=A0A6C2YTV7_9BACT|nr:glutamine--fructose-6-phosphate transaminase (isomerizing) [Tuwongella immobilis]VIP04563.1 glutamine amidotransferase : Glutamine--fructose-6-phosphate aminotransferase [isomerizing] OS=uncultured planctomycete GN=glmS PE=3 SV=1: GATase_6: SIS: SIS [Tuwongella immobilis]VTS06487.1 glutamine amidotransferase : Glutamine--fructose-6-phosphate aminotransferase [isomerizing] OS=uncultured planctomycete GN=glmS PE=3 SV=1: GATase_6: SIS: SIS [Tuwongella immobilis]